MNPQSITPRASVPPRVRVTQATLRECQALAALARQLRELRGRVADALAAGASVEPGELTAKLQSRQRRSLTIAKVTAVLGDARTQDLLGRIEPTTSRSLEIRAVRAEAAAARPQAATRPPAERRVPPW